MVAGMKASTSLRQKIKGSNNGYLFAPSGEEIETAKANPAMFRVAHDPRATDFPYRIFNNAIPLTRSFEAINFVKGKGWRFAGWEFDGQGETYFFEHYFDSAAKAGEALDDFLK